METTHLDIPTYRLDEFDKRIKSLSRRAIKLNLEPPATTKGEPFVSEFVEIDDIGRERTRTIEYTPVEISWTPIVHAGGEREWKIIAEIEPATVAKDTTPLNHVTAFGGGIEDLTEYRTIELRCDHCRTKRWRRHNFLVEAADGERLIVGSACLQDFVGIDVGNALRSVSLIRSFTKAFDEDQWLPGSGCPEMWRTEWIGTLTAAVIRDANGLYVKRDHPNIASYYNPHGVVPTIDAVKNALYKPREIEFDVSAEDKALAVEFLTEKADLVARLESDVVSMNDFEYGLALILKTGYADDRRTGLLVGAMGGWIKYRQMRAKAEAKRNARGGSNHFGEIRKRAEFELLFERLIIKDGQWGVSYILSGVRCDNGQPTGDQFVWFGNPDSASDFLNWDKGPAQVADKVFKVKATPKRHDTSDRYGNTTVLSRVKVC